MGLLWAVQGGCATIPVTRIPDFWEPGRFESVTVLPFDDARVLDPHAGDNLAGQLAAALAENGTYPFIYGGDRFGMLGPSPGHSGGVVLTGDVLRFHVISQEELRYVQDRRRRDNRAARPGRGRGGSVYRDPSGRVYRRVDGHRYVCPADKEGHYEVRLTHTATVAVTAALRASETGQVVHATRAPVVTTGTTQGDTYNDPGHALHMAVSQAVDGLVREFAVTEGEVKVDPKKALRTTAGRVEKGQWVEQGAFPADGRFVAVVALPDDAHRNPFRLGIGPKDSEVDLAEQFFTWDRHAGHRGQAFPFDLATIASAGGVGDYELRFYARDELVMTRDFEVFDTP